MHKKFLIVSLLSILMLGLTNIALANKKIFYNSLQDFDSGRITLSENYICNLDELENFTISLIKQKKFADTIEVYSKCIATYPNVSNLYNNRANLYKMLKMYDLALVDYEKAIALDENYLSPQLGKSTTLILLSKTDEAIEILDGIIKKNNKEAMAYYNKGLALFFKNDNERALKNYNLAIKYAKCSLPDVYFERGKLWAFYKKNYKRALSDYTKAINLLESDENINFVNFNSLAEIYHNRSITYYKLNNEKMMINDLIKAMLLYEKEGNHVLAKEIQDTFLQDYLSKWIIFDDETHIVRNSIQSFNTNSEDGQNVFYIYYSKDIKTPSNSKFFEKAEKKFKTEISYLIRYIIINATQKKYANKSALVLNKNGKIIEKMVFDNNKLIWYEYAPDSKIAKVLECIIEEIKK